MSGYKTRSDSLMLMRQIKSLKDLGSNLGGDLETSSRTFLSGVQIVRTGNKPQVLFVVCDKQCTEGHDAEISGAIFGCLLLEQVQTFGVWRIFLQILKAGSSRQKERKVLPPSQ